MEISRSVPRSRSVVLNPRGSSYRFALFRFGLLPQSNPGLSSTNLDQSPREGEKLRRKVFLSMRRINVRSVVKYSPYENDPNDGRRFACLGIVLSRNVVCNRHSGQLPEGLQLPRRNWNG